MPKTVSRRRFLHSATCSAAGGYLVFALGGCRREKALLFLSAAELETTAAACERMLPRDQDPGAIDLGVPHYVDRALAFDDHAHWGERFRAGLRALDDDALRRTGKRFHRGRATEQDDILDEWQDGTPDQVTFVRILMALTLEGAFGDPAYGGNREGRGWRLIGFEPCEPRHGRG
jgi:gluconate 2-dehydrogenase gamma chain